MKFLVKVSQMQNLELHFRICYKCIPIFRTQTAAHEVIRKALRELVWEFLSFYAGIFLINFRLGSAANTERAERRALYLVGLAHCKGTYKIYGS